MSVAEYEASFARLERFAQAFDSEERRAERFLEGLQPSLRVKVMDCRCTTVAEMVQMASRFEEEYNQYVSGHSKGKAKLPFTSRFSVSSPPSSSGMSSPGKRKKDRSGSGSGARRSFARGGGGVGPASSARHSFAGVGSTGLSQAASSGQGSC